MDCKFSGCDCYLCARNKEGKVCKYYLENCFKRPDEKTIVDCDHLIITYNKGPIASLIERIVDAWNARVTKWRIKYYLTKGYVTDCIFGR